MQCLFSKLHLAHKQGALKNKSTWLWEATSTRVARISAQKTLDRETWSPVTLITATLIWIKIFKTAKSKFRFYYWQNWCFEISAFWNWHFNHFIVWVIAYPTTLYGTLQRNTFENIHKQQSIFVSATTISLPSVIKHFTGVHYGTEIKRNYIMLALKSKT